MGVVRFFIFSLTIGLVACAANDTDEHAENARFALDSGNFAKAVAEIDPAYSASPADEEIVLLRASAYAGRGGVDLLELAKKLVDVGNESTAFKTIHDALVSLIGTTGLADLNTAVSTLQTYIDKVGGATKVVRKSEVYGNLGILQSIEAFALPTINAQPASGGSITVASISDANRSTVANDLLAADDNLVTQAGYPATNQLVKTVRKNYCVLKNVSAGGNFELSELRDLTLCQLHSDSASLTTANFGTAGITSCASAFVFGNCDGTENTAN